MCEQFTMTKSNDKQGFSLIELLVALSILAVVAAIIVPRFLNVRSQAASTTTEAQRKVIQNAVQQFLALGGTNTNNAVLNSGNVLYFLNQTGSSRTGTNISDSSGAFSSSSISLQLDLTQAASGVSEADLSGAESGFYISAANGGQAVYLDGNGTRHTITINADGSVDFN